MKSIRLTDNPGTEYDKIAMDNFRDTLTFEDNRYQVTWPWKTENSDLPQSRELAMGRPKSCVSKVKHKPELMMKYDGIIQAQLNKGIIERIDANSADGVKHYLPHLAVINRTMTTTKLMWSMMPLFI